MTPSSPRTTYPPIHPRLARRIDHLAIYAHAFHRWSHHPLCSEYEGEVIRLGRRVRLCRGCTLAALGAGAGGLLGTLIHPPPTLALLALAGLGTLAGVLALSQQRHSKWGTRALPAAMVVMLPLWALRHGDLVSWALAGYALLGATATWLAYRRRGPSRTPCSTCPEFGNSGTCRGFREIRRRERAFARLASIWLRAKDPVR